MAKPKLTKRQKDFADEYIITGNAYASALKAGYSKKYAKSSSHLLMDNVGIKAYIATRLNKVDSKVLAKQVDVHSVIDKLISEGAAIDYTSVIKERKEFSVEDSEGNVTRVTQETQPIRMGELLKALELKAKLDNLFKSDEYEEDYEVVKIVDDIE